MKSISLRCMECSLCVLYRLQLVCQSQELRGYGSARWQVIGLIMGRGGLCGEVLEYFIKVLLLWLPVYVSCLLMLRMLQDPGHLLGHAGIVDLLAVEFSRARPALQHRQHRQ